MISSAATGAPSFSCEHLASGRRHARVDFPEQGVIQQGDIVPQGLPGENWGATTPEGEAKQAEDTVKFYRALFAHPAVEAITWWDFSDRGAWQRAAAGWLRKDQSPKPVYDRLLALIKGEWWTKTESQPNAQGEVTLRTFYGTHRVTATLPSGAKVEKEVHVQRGKPNQFELTVA